MLKFFRLPFAEAGDRTAIPDAIDVNGFVSYEQGYGFDYQRQKTDPAAKNIERDKMNSLFFDVTTAIAEMQAQGIPDFITSALNGGTAYEYDVNAVCRYLGDIYVSRKTANTSLPSVAADWFKVRLATPRTVAGGTADAITADFVPNLGTLQDGDMLMIQHGAANATTTPTINPDGTGALSIYKGSNSALSAGDIAGADFWGVYIWDASLSKLQMVNPATGVSTASIGAGQSWQNVAASRATGSTYTNSTGRPIQICITVTTNAIQFTIDGLVVVPAIMGNLELSGLIIPAGSTYSLGNSAVISTWFELR